MPISSRFLPRFEMRLPWRPSLSRVSEAAHVLGNSHPVVHQSFYGMAQRRLAARNGTLNRAVDDGIANLPPQIRMISQVLGCLLRRQGWFDVAGNGDHHGGQRTVKGPGGPWGDAGRLDSTIEAAVELAELLVMHPVAWLVDVEDGRHQSRPCRIAADAAGRLGKNSRSTASRSEWVLCASPSRVSRMKAS